MIVKETGDGHPGRNKTDTDKKGTFEKDLCLQS